MQQKEQVGASWRKLGFKIYQEGLTGQSPPRMKIAVD